MRLWKSKRWCPFNQRFVLTNLFECSNECYTNHCLGCTLCYFDRIYTTNTLQMPFKDICCLYNIAYTTLQYCLYNILKVQTSSTSYKYKLLSVPFHLFNSTIKISNTNTNITSIKQFFCVHIWIKIAVNS